MKLTNQSIMQLCGAIESIPPLKSAPKATYALARNLSKLKPIRQDIFDSRQRIFEEQFDLEKGQKFSDKYPLTYPDDVSAEAAQRLAENHLREHTNYPKADEAFQKVLGIEVEFTPHQFSIEDLNLNDNAISVQHLEALLPLIKDDK